MNASSDLDLIVIYDADGVDMSDGRRPLATRTYYARLTQALITAMSAPMSQGRLYDIDMRLRPSGKQGPVATSWPAYQSYQQTEAWLWEHLALTRARCITGPPDLMNEIEAFRASILSQPRALAEIAQGVADMRSRLSAAKPAAGWLDLRNGPGRLQDIELLAQGGHLLTGAVARGVWDGLTEAGQAGWLASDDVAMLQDAAMFYWRLYAALRLIGEQDPEALGAGAIAFLGRTMNVAGGLDPLRAQLEDRYKECAARIDAALARGGAQDGATE